MIFWLEWSFSPFVLIKLILIIFQDMPASFPVILTLCKMFSWRWLFYSILISSPCYVPGYAGLPPSPESLRSRYHTAEQESMSSGDDFLDLSTPGGSSGEKPVSFKTEVATSPHASPAHTLDSGQWMCWFYLCLFLWILTCSWCFLQASLKLIWQ